MILLSDPGLPGQVEVHHMIEGMLSALPKYVHQGYTIIIEPFDSSTGKCAVVQDAFGTRFCIVESADKKFWHTAVCQTFAYDGVDLGGDNHQAW